MLLVSGKLIGDQLFSTHSTSRVAVAAAVLVFVVLILSEVARGRFQRVIDRQFFREKYKFDRAMQKMRLAVGSLIDQATAWGIGCSKQRLRFCGSSGGALHLEDIRRGGRCNWWPATGPRLSERSLASDHPLVGPVAADARRPAFSRAGTQWRKRPRHGRDDRAGG